MGSSTVYMYMNTSMRRLYVTVHVSSWILEREMDWKRLCSCHTIYASGLLRPFFPCFFIICLNSNRRQLICSIAFKTRRVHKY